MTKLWALTWPWPGEQRSRKDQVRAADEGGGGRERECVCIYLCEDGEVKVRESWAQHAIAAAAGIGVRGASCLWSSGVRAGR